MKASGQDYAPAALPLAKGLGTALHSRLDRPQNWFQRCGLIPGANYTD
jgi:hypothetical protein